MRNNGRGPMDQFTAHLDRGWDLVSRGDYAGALVSAEKSLELDAESPEAHNLIGYIHAAEGHAEDALEHYKQAIELDETFVEAMLNAAEVLIHPLADFELALRMVDDAMEYMEDDEERADALLLKHEVLVHLDDQDGAKRVMKLLPDGPFESPHLELLAGRALFDHGDIDAAELRLRRASDRDPKNGEVQYCLGLIHEARQDLRGATVCFLRARELDLSLPPPAWTIAVDQFERRVQAAIHRLDESLRNILDGALVVVSDVPGAEVVADGVDPRVLLLLDEVNQIGDRLRVGRVFVYQRNVERAVGSVLEIEDELVHAFTAELGNLLPAAAAPPDGDAAPETESA